MTWNAGDHAEVHNGLGGVFRVRLLERTPNGWWTCMIDMHNPDWDGMAWGAWEKDLRPI